MHGVKGDHTLLLPRCFDRSYPGSRTCQAGTAPAQLSALVDFFNSMHPSEAPWFEEDGWLEDYVDPCIPDLEDSWVGVSCAIDSNGFPTIT